ncbi:hypothetical protein AAVH_21094 [Aphelenchoides avenae]|nr:hypothetical protein AAVH_21094 [Aphelenchus avenae]
MDEEASQRFARDLSEKYDVHIRELIALCSPKNLLHRTSGQPAQDCARLVGTEPNLTACKEELCRFFAFIEKKKALKMREEVESSGGEPEPSDEEQSFTSKLLSCARIMAAMRVEAYFSEENQQS